MAVYLTSLLFSYVFLLLSRFEKNRNNKIMKKIYITISLLVLTIVAGIRYDVGTDFMMYEDFFNRANDLTLFTTRLEFMFICICKIIYFFTTNSFFMFFAIALFIYYHVYKMAVNTNKMYEITIFLFICFGFYTGSLNIMRQWMGIVMMFMALLSFNMNKKKAIIYAIIGVLCHYTALVTIPIYYLCTKIKSNKTRMMIIITSILLYLNLDFVLSICYEILNFIGIGAKYYKYFLNYDALNTNILAMPMFTLITYVGYLLFVSKKNKENDKENNVDNVVNTVIFGFVTSLLGTRNIIFERIQYYFTFGIIFLIPLILERTNKKITYMLYTFCIVAGTIFYIYILSKNGGEPLPYKTIFNY